MKKPAIKPCPAPGCQAHIPGHMRFCNEDFRKLPREIKDRLTTSYEKRDVLAGANAFSDALAYLTRRHNEIQNIQDYR